MVKAELSGGVGLRPDLAPRSLEGAWRRLQAFETELGDWWARVGRGNLYLLIEVDEPNGPYQSKASFVRGDMMAFAVLKADALNEENAERAARDALREGIALAARRVRAEPMPIPD